MEETNSELNKIKLSNYKNSTHVVDGATVEDITKACLLGRLNMFFVGETGEGKTQLENDLLAVFGNNGFFEQGRNDLTIRDMFTKLNLEKLRTGASTQDVKELTEKVKHPIYVVDELSRCIPAVQNQFFNLFDGFITVDGRKHKLGDGGYNIGIASGNIGNGKYVGTSEIDRALRDRMHLILDVDYFPSKPTDTLEILAAKKDPRVSDSEGSDLTETISKLHEEFKNKKPSLLQYAAILYFVHALDYLEGIPGNSKKKNKNAWPGCVKGHEKGSDEALIFPFSKRSAISTLTLANALEEVKKAKGDEYKDSVEPVFDAAYLIGAQSGVLHSAAVDAHYGGNPYSAMQSVIDGIKGEFAAKKDILNESIASAQKGKLIHMDELDGRWSYMKDVLQEAAGQEKK